jgi:ParB/RepB/Spo0J family partition protein
MPASGEFISVRVSSVKIPPGRMRKKFDQEEIENLAGSIKRHGQLEPIGIDRKNNLYFGERRLIAKKLLKHEWIDAQYVDDLTPDEGLAIELEENLHREDLTWQEVCLSVIKYHDLKVKLVEGWDVDKTGISLGISKRTVFRHIQVGRALKEGVEGLGDCSAMSAAFNILERAHSRALDLEMEQLGEGLQEEGEEEETYLGEMSRRDAGEIILTSSGKIIDKDLTPRPASKDIHLADFNEWAPLYEGPRFNFIHCDFPYGIEHHKSDQGAAKEHGAYRDTEATYWTLLQTLLSQRDRLMAESAHIMFWFSMQYYIPTVTAFRACTKKGTRDVAEFRVEHFPLIWYKSDNTGILPDPARGPRRVYETALIVSRGDRKIIRATSNVVAAPANKAEAKHLSEKPEIVLSEFLKMFVDNTSIVLDPTCGSGSALATATGMWAMRVTGLDIDPKHVEMSRLQVNSRRAAMAGMAGQELGEEDAPEDEDLDIDWEPEE